MERQEITAREHSEEHKAALERAVELDVPHALAPYQYGTFDEEEEEGQDEGSCRSMEASLLGSSRRTGSEKESLDELTECLLDKDETGHINLKKSPSND